MPAQGGHDILAGVQFLKFRVGKFKNGIGHVDGFEKVFSLFIALVQVGVMLFGQFLVPRLDIGERDRWLKPEQRQRFEFRCFVRDARRSLEAAFVLRRFFFREVIGLPCRAAQVFSHSAIHIVPPCRAVAVERIDDVVFDFVVVHAGEKVPSGVVFLHMVEAEPVMVGKGTVFGGAVFAVSRASRHVASLCPRSLFSSGPLTTLGLSL